MTKERGTTHGRVHSTICRYFRWHHAVDTWNEYHAGHWSCHRHCSILLCVEDRLTGPENYFEGIDVTFCYLFSGTQFIPAPNQLAHVCSWYISHRNIESPGLRHFENRGSGDSISGKNFFRRFLFRLCNLTNGRQVPKDELNQHFKI